MSAGWLLALSTADKKVAEKLYPSIKSKISNIAEVKIIKCKSQIGSGSLPVELLPSYGVEISAKNLKRNSNKLLQSISKKFRELPIPVIGRLSKNSLIFDCRCLEDTTLIIKQLEKINSEYFLNT